MKMPAINHFRHIAKTLRKGSRPKALILMYHRIIDIASDPWALCVTPAHFAEHLDVIRKYYLPLDLHNLVQVVRNRDDIQRPSVVVTFDDGYADNLHNAKPLLERFDIPASVFVATGHVGNENEFWWDELDKIFLQPGNLPEVLNIKINGKNYKWTLGRSTYYSKDNYLLSRNLRAWEGEEGSRHYLYHSLWQLIRILPKDERKTVLKQLIEWAGCAPVSRVTHLTLTDDEIIDLATGQLIEIGSHTVTHPYLSSQSIIFQRDEIQHSKTHLEDVLGRQVTSFAYPYGDYSAETVALVREAGFTCACSTVEETVWKKSNRYQLPRVQVRDWDGEEFEKQLLRWFHR